MNVTKLAITMGIIFRFLFESTKNEIRDTYADSANL